MSPICVRGTRIPLSLQTVSLSHVPAGVGTFVRKVFPPLRIFSPLQHEGPRPVSRCGPLALSIGCLIVRGDYFLATPTGAHVTTRRHPQYWPSSCPPKAREILTAHLATLQAKEDALQAVLKLLLSPTESTAIIHATRDMLVPHSVPSLLAALEAHMPLASAVSLTARHIGLSTGRLYQLRRDALEVQGTRSTPC